jgi:hypothetical protein
MAVCISFPVPFSVWVTSAEHHWVTLAKRRRAHGAGSVAYVLNRSENARSADVRLREPVLSTFFNHRRRMAHDTCPRTQSWLEKGHELGLPA